MITLRRARPGDAVAIGAVHVAVWRNSYPGLVPDEYLAGLSVPRQAAHYESIIRSGGGGIYVATASGLDVPNGGSARIVGFVTAVRARAGALTDRRLGDGEIETLYVLDDWRERGIGRRLMRAAANSLAESGCRSVYLWVLRDNPSRWFYQRLGGEAVAESPISVAGRPLVQTAFAWDPIDKLLQASPLAS